MSTFVQKMKLHANLTWVRVTPVRYSKKQNLDFKSCLNDLKNENSSYFPNAHNVSYCEKPSMHTFIKKIYIIKIFKTLHFFFFFQNTIT